MNYLALVQRLWLESGVSGSSPGPTTVAGQSGEYARLVTWVNQAWRDIQMMHRDWGWMRTGASFATVLGTSTYALGSGAGTVGVAAANFGMWDRKTARSYLTSAGTDSEQFLRYIPYDDWRDTYLMGAYRSTNTPPVGDFSISPAKAICLAPTLAGYTITCDYFSAPTDMLVDADEPTMPEQFHMAIVWLALMRSGAYESASEVYQWAEKEFKRYKALLEADRLPEVAFGGTLA